MQSLEEEEFLNRMACVLFVCLCLSSIFSTTALLYLDPTGGFLLAVLCCRCFAISCSRPFIWIHWVDV